MAAALVGAQHQREGLYGLCTKLYTGAETLDDLYLIADGIRPVR